MFSFQFYHKNTKMTVYKRTMNSLKWFLWPWLWSCHSMRAKYILLLCYYVWNIWLDIFLFLLEFLINAKKIDPFYETLMHVLITNSDTFFDWFEFLNAATQFILQLFSFVFIITREESINAVKRRWINESCINLHLIWN